MGTLNGRIGHLEAAVAAGGGPDRCRPCGQRHVRPLTIALLRGILRVAGGSGCEAPATPLCLCECCTADPGDRWLARRSHGLPRDEDAA